MSINLKNRAGIRDKIKGYCKQNNTCGQEKEEYYKGRKLTSSNCSVLSMPRLDNQRWSDFLLSPLRFPARSPSMPICSSRSGHSIAYPSPRNLQLLRSSLDPYINRGDQLSGTISLRPSASSTIRLLSSIVTKVAVGSASKTKVLMPCLQKCLTIFNNKTSYTV